MSIDTAIYLRVVGYLLFLAAPFVGLFVKGVSKNIYAVFAKYIMTVFVMYLFIVIPLYNLNSILDGIVISLDRDGNGSIGKDEEATWTGEEIRAQNMWVGDGARNVFGYLVSPIVATVYAAISFAAFYIGLSLINRFKQRRNA